MARGVFLVAFIFVATFCFSQKIPLIHSGQVIEKGKELYDSGKFAEALKEFYKVPERDTNYVFMLYEAALAHIGDKNYDKALEVCDKGLKNPETFHADFLRLQAVATDKKGEVEKSIVLFKKASEQYPGDYNLLYNLGITYYNSKAYEKAVETFFKVLYLNPFHAGSHLNLGRISIGQGRKTHAMLSLGVYLSIASSDNPRLVMLNNFVDNQSTDEGIIPLFGTNAPEKLDQIIKAKIAMDKSFKTKVPVDVAIVRQYTMLFEQLGTINGDTDDPWVKFYADIYKTIKERELIEPFLYHLLASSSNETVKKWRLKNEKLLGVFFEIVNQKMRTYRERPDPAVYGFGLFGFNKPVMAWYDDEQKLDALGEKVNDVRQGNWVYFYNNQQRSGEGAYNDKGSKKGVWKYYNPNGSIKSIENYDTGEITLFYASDAKREHYYLKDGKTEGDVEFYYSCGALKEKLPYQADVRNGKGQTYYESGKTKMTYEYLQNKGKGEFVTYYESGTVLNKANYVDDKLTGKYTSYHPNGKIKIEGEYLNDAPTGTWKYYFSNGKIDKTGNYVKGIATGEWNYYEADGTLIEKRLFDAEGRYQGDNTIYHNEKVQTVYTFKKDLLIKVTAFSDQGKELFKGTGNDGTLPVKTFFSSGELRSEGNYKKGKQQGKLRHYFRNGKLLSEFNYEDGLIQGLATEYFETGKKKYISNYKDGELHGYFQEFFEHGQVKQEGWFQNGQRQQQWITYYPDGTVKNDYFYLSDELFKNCYDYANDGKMYSQSRYDRNGLIDVTYYDLKGEITFVDKMDKNIITIDDKYANKKPRAKYQMLCGEYTGQFSRWYPDGNICYSYSLVNGKMNGPYTHNFPNNKVQAQGYYLNGEEDGMWKIYYDNGQLSQEGKYREGKADSIWNYYYPHGKTSSTILYLNHERHGIARYFSPEGTPLIEKLYDQDHLISYRVPDANGSWGEWTRFSGDGKIVANYPNGKPAWEETFANGVRHGVKKTYYANGSPCDEYLFTEGWFEGPYATYFPNGKLREKGVYKNDELEGKVEAFNEDGTLRKTELYKTGSRSGKTTLYNKGAKANEITFWNGLPEE